MTENTMEIHSVEGSSVPVRGHDIDTDRIMPARFLRCVTFDGIEAHTFEDDIRGLKVKGEVHPFADPRFANASVLLVNKNFGCGSSREHAPAGLKRWGIQAVIGESFAEIFFGNCCAIGVPCLTVSATDIETLMRSSEEQPDTKFTVDLDRLVVETPGVSIKTELDTGPRDAFRNGTWNATQLLLERYDEVKAVAARLPYLDY